MTWLISEAMMKAYGNLPSSPEPVVESSADICLDGEPSAQSSGNPTQLAFLSHGKTTAFSRLSRFGMMCKPLTDAHGEALLTSYLADFLVKTSALPETGPDWTAKGQGYGEKWRGLLAKYNPDTHSLKTAQLSLLEDLTGCCATLPRWGLMLDGELYPQPTPALRTEENDYGLLRIQTPTVEDAGRAGKVSNWLEWLDKRRTTQCRLRNQAAHMDQRDGILNPEWTEWLMGWPMGWTDLKPLEMGRFREWQQQHSPFFRQEADAV